MSDLTLITNAEDPASVLPALALLQHRVRVLPADTSSIVRIPDNTIVFVDARHEVASAKQWCSLTEASGIQVPLIVILSEGGCLGFNASWNATDFVVDTASPAEVETRVRIITGGGLHTASMQSTPPTSKSHSFNSSASTSNFEAHGDAVSQERDGIITCGELEVDTIGYSATLRGEPLDLAYKEFELLKYFVMHPGRAFTRSQLLQEVWGYDYYGGTRTVDVHVRRLRAKLGVEFEYVIGTVRNVGYRFDPPQSVHPKQKS
ncbi:winged helix-turn-helix domain-containing protein [Alloscardovia venturai]|uniref:Winged helix-turn-helix domain-containing protein n=1 Tax=Alloscardovia venturai TaxID=1769421 RepID=A0ABW2Y3X5_9BIFI